MVKTKQKGKHIYYNCSISRYNFTPKNCYLGNEVKIQKHLKEFYKKDKDKLKKIDKDWFGELIYDCKVGFVYDMIFDLIIKYADKFQKTTINLDTLYPLKQMK